MFKLFQLEAISDQVKKSKEIKIDAQSATLNSSGEIIYGPYTRLNKGHYMLSVDIDADNSVDSYLDITSAHAQIKYKKVFLKDLKSIDYKIEFDIPEIAHDFEVRFHCHDNNKNIKLRNYSLHSSEPQLFGCALVSQLINIIPEYGEYEYRSATVDPQIHVKLQQKLDGYLIVKLLIFSEEEIGNCDIFSIKNGRYNEMISVPYLSGKEIVMYIRSEEIEELRIDPLEKDGIKFSFSIEVEYIHEVSSNDLKEVVKETLSFYKPKLIEDEISYINYKKILTNSAIYVKQNINYLLWKKNTEDKWISQKEDCGKPLNTDIKFSIVMPVYNSNLTWLQEAIDCVLSQTYDNFELIIVNDGSTNPNVTEFLHDYILKDARLILLNRDSNGGISAATLNGISNATGSYVCFMDHDDLLSKYALSNYADLIHKNQNTSMIYSDEDLIDEYSNRSSPHFKPDFNLDLLLSHNYITHFVCARKELIEDWKPIKAIDGAQDYDLILHVVSKVPEDTILHDSNVLYHWRAHNLSTAKNSGVKKYTIQAGKTAIERYLTKLNISAVVENTNIHHFYRVKYNINKPYHASKISIIIPTKDNVKLLRTCIESIISLTEYDNYDIIIVDNQSTDKEAKTYLSFLSKLSNVTVIPYWMPFNWAAINNYAAKQTNAEYLLFLNNDIEIIDSTWLTEMVSQLERPSIGVVGAKLVYPDYSIQHAGVIIGLGGLAAHQFAGYGEYHPGYSNRINLVQQLSAVTGACLGVKRSIFNELGGFDERLEVAYNDIEFCVRVDKAGHKIIYDPFVKMIHYESKTRGYDVGYEKARRLSQEADLFISLHPDSILYDRFYNVNLSNDNCRFDIKIN